MGILYLGISNWIRSRLCDYQKEHICWWQKSNLSFFQNFPGFWNRSKIDWVRAMSSCRWVKGVGKNIFDHAMKKNEKKNLLQNILADCQQVWANSEVVCFFHLDWGIFSHIYYIITINWIWTMNIWFFIYCKFFSHFFLCDDMILFLCLIGEPSVSVTYSQNCIVGNILLDNEHCTFKRNAFLSTVIQTFKRLTL